MARPILLLSLIVAGAGARLAGGDGEGAPSGGQRVERAPAPRRLKREWIWNQLHIMEEINTPLPHHVGKITSSVNNKNAKYVLQGPYVETIFKVKEDTGDIYAYEKLDREKIAEYHLTALIIDKYTNRNLEPPSNFTIKVYDVNDNVPEFVQKEFNGSVPEMSPVGTSVTRVTAVDADDPTVAGHAIVQYTIISGQKYFMVDPTGLISTAVNDLDREKQSFYEIVVQAKDSPGLYGGDSSTATVKITLTDINDNFPKFTQTRYRFNVSEDIRVGNQVDSLTVEDIDEPQNRKTKYNFVQGDYRDTFEIEADALANKGIIKAKKPLDYESIKSYKFTVEASDPTIVHHGRQTPHYKSNAEVIIHVLDVDEPPVFFRPYYVYTLKENIKVNVIGRVVATDPDAEKRTIRYSIRSHSDKGNFFKISKQGDISNTKPLDRETQPWYNLTIEAREINRDGSPTDKESIVQVHIEVLDENDNAPEFAQPYEPKVCENAAPGTLVMRISAADKDKMPPGAKFKYSLGTGDSNFTLTENHDNTANITIRFGQFDREKAKVHYLPVVISDNGTPDLTSTNTLVISVCKCNEQGEFTFCDEPVKQVGVSIQALVAIFLCILTIIVITLLIILRRRQRREAKVLRKSGAEIHEQLVTYDEEGGGEMDTTSYDVSVLNSVRKNGLKPPRPALEARPSLYAQVQKPPRHVNAGTGEMAVMIEVKKDEADHDGGGPPYDTLHIYGYEGAESIAESLSSLGSDSSSSDIDYDFLNDWGPRFKMLAELYGSEARPKVGY
ncbi:cadherin-5 [Ornithorhynchus anatinus]|nr:cadherin-5 [Ornithorhynchus anatinus]